MKHLILALFIWGFFFATGQNPQNTYANYARIAWGGSAATYRDFATSPLFYAGLMGHYRMDHWVRTSKTERQFLSQFSGGHLSQLYNGVYNSATVIQADFSYSWLYRLPRWSTPKQRWVLGAMLATSGGVRLNQSLMNNSTGFEVLSNFYVSAGWRRDISRLRTRQLALGNKTLRLKQRRKELLWDAHFGILNRTLRNGFAYIYDDPSTEISSLYPSYEWRWGGFRVQSRLTYQWYKANGNGYGLSYIWDAGQTGGPFETYQFAAHHVAFFLLFQHKTKKS